MLEQNVLSQKLHNVKASPKQMKLLSSALLQKASQADSGEYVRVYCQNKYLTNDELPGLKAGRYVKFTIDSASEFSQDPQIDIYLPEVEEIIEIPEKF